jgi:antitoxin (DNA-binding transcriptional repressor) of toxin-antitoxin stability system
MTVSIAQLKNGLSGYLQRVRAGETILIRDRDLPIARIEPLTGDISAEEAELAAAGLLILPAEPFDPDAILKCGTPTRMKSKKSVSEIISEDRDASDARILG